MNYSPLFSALERDCCLPWAFIEGRRAKVELPEWN
jgi:hypothetical protein